MHNEILLSFIYKKKHLATNSKSQKSLLSQKTYFSDFFLKTVFISVSPCYQNYTLSHISTKFQTYTETVEIKGSVQQK